MSGPCTPYPLGDNSSPPPWRVCQTQSLDFSRPNGREIFQNLKTKSNKYLLDSEQVNKMCDFDKDFVGFPHATRALIMTHPPHASIAQHSLHRSFHPMGIINYYSCFGGQQVYSSHFLSV